MLPHTEDLTQRYQIRSNWTGIIHASYSTLVEAIVARKGDMENFTIDDAEKDAR